MTKRYLSILLLGAVTLFHACWLQAGAIDEAVRRGSLKVGTNPTYMPFQMTDRQGRVVGFEIDLLHEMSKSLGVKLELLPSGYPELIPNLLAGKTDLVASGMTLTQERNLRLNFSDPFIVVGQTLLIPLALANKVQSFEDLNEPGYRLRVKAGTTGEIVARRMIGKAQLVSYATEEEGVQDVIDGKADAFIHDAPYNLVAVNKLGQGKLLCLEQPFTYEPLAFGLKKGDHDSLNWINHFLHQIAEDGTYDRIHDKWFKETAWLAEID
ncbi:amino acid ABC transporter substrate-binding protein [Pseudomonas gingeri NCPPB 3146 = LMG 5327]|uniref:Transporter substrate-binding domain-containing protein n=2 Tax=Pseudomonas gingeri TaxID=117681 RepID=A0A7Y7Y2R6_9PSED|nr:MULTISPECIES: transporter substrate-binding domain-containing protein [Pseudomonas]NVZ25184.1 transporter substrate-binding domain-containing protein [Pseudomonas gingeri]NVZ61568.1 transporter substrate-binding domain-containing protein [Pseudomonas gingeri]NVZ78149.1 transporter substrate-binding domain-containing protein [Pseudomonas gingeri]NWA06711.1 transporter substrate-binding domain-containing protein [Pseudomonas gingeri]NWC15607.1 transporter substrate-binding domain-containing p